MGTALLQIKHFVSQAGNRGRPVKILNRQQVQAQAHLDLLNYHIKQKRKHIELADQTTHPDNAQVHRDVARWHDLEMQKHANAATQCERAAMQKID